MAINAAATTGASYLARATGLLSRFGRGAQQAVRNTLPEGSSLAARFDSFSPRAAGAVAAGAVALAATPATIASTHTYRTGRDTGHGVLQSGAAASLGLLSLPIAAHWKREAKKGEGPMADTSQSHSPTSTAVQSGDEITIRRSV